MAAERTVVATMEPATTAAAGFDSASVTAATREPRMGPTAATAVERIAPTAPACGDGNGGDSEGGGGEEPGDGEGGGGAGGGGSRHIEAPDREGRQRSSKIGAQEDAEKRELPRD